MVERLEQCLACAEGGLRPWFVRRTTHGDYPVVRCGACGSAFVYPRPTAEALERFYRDQAYRGEGELTPQERLDRLLAEEAAYPNSVLDAERMLNHARRESAGDRLLDVGSGFGMFSRAALARGFRVEALDPSPAGREVYTLLNGFAPLPQMLDAEFAARRAGAFDVVLLSQVVEHLADCDAALAAVSRVAATPGLVVVATPHFRSAVSLLQGRRDMFITPPEHLNFFTARGLVRLFARQGFQLVRLETISRFDPRRLRRKIPLPGAMALLSALLAAADAVGRGMYLNAYFRRSTGGPSA